jgi:peptidoglycan/xylan/chitin deacetylase (PgdA/CDA1 family)
VNRERLSHVFDTVGGVRAVMALRRRAPNPWLTVVTYHRVADRVAAARELDEHVVDTTPDRFEQQLAFITRWFDPIGIDDLLAFRKHGRPLPRNPILVTFDDGYRDNHDVALPVLRRHGVRATFFVATHFVEARRLFWWDRINLLLKRSTRDRVELEYPVRAAYAIDTPTGRGEAIRAALRTVKSTYDLDLERFLGDLARACGVTLGAEDERALVERIVMTWDHVRALRAAGMDVQSHTATHRVVQTLPDTALERELKTSRATLEAVLNEPVRAVSYPVGRARDYDRRIRDLVSGAGYELGFSNATGVNDVFRFDPLNTRRLAVEAGLSDAYFRAMLAVPLLAH